MNRESEHAIAASGAFLTACTVLLVEFGRRFVIPKPVEILGFTVLVILGSAYAVLIYALRRTRQARMRCSRDVYEHHQQKSSPRNPALPRWTPSFSLASLALLICLLFLSAFTLIVPLKFPSRHELRVVTGTVAECRQKDSGWVCRIDTGKGANETLRIASGLADRKAVQVFRTIRALVQGRYAVELTSNGNTAFTYRQYRHVESKYARRLASVYAGCTVLYACWLVRRRSRSNRACDG